MTHNVASGEGWFGSGQLAAGESFVHQFDQPGTFYGCQSYIQLLEQFGSAEMEGLFCYDYPDRPWRGMMIRVRYKFDMDWSKEVIDLLARFKFNIVQLDTQRRAYVP